MAKGIPNKPSNMKITFTDFKSLLIANLGNTFITMWFIWTYNKYGIPDCLDLIGFITSLVTGTF